MQRALDSAMGLPRRSTSASSMLVFLIPAEVCSSFIIPLLDGVMGACRLLQSLAHRSTLYARSDTYGLSQTTRSPMLGPCFIRREEQPQERQCAFFMSTVLLNGMERYWKEPTQEDASATVR